MLSMLGLGGMYGGRETAVEEAQTSRSEKSGRHEGDCKCHFETKVVGLLFVAALKRSISQRG
jgi:hypothetical protein